MGEARAKGRRSTSRVCAFPEAMRMMPEVPRKARLLEVS